MTLIIDLSVEHEAALKAKAEAQGVSVEHYASRVLEMHLNLASGGAGMSAEEKAREFDDWADSFPDTPPLSDEAISRESFYPDRW